MTSTLRHRGPSLAALFVALSLQQTPQFEPFAKQTLAAGGALVNAFADFDGNGTVDLFVGFNGTPNKLYKFDGKSLIDVAAEVGVADARATRAAAWGDFDGDGDADLLVGFAPGPGGVLKLYRNDKGKFYDVTTNTGLVVDRGAVRQESWIDFDGDGDNDLFVGFRDRPNMLFVNTGGTFKDVARERGLGDSLKTVGAVWFDWDHDTDLDLLVAHMDGQPNTLYRNDDSRFKACTTYSDMQLYAPFARDTTLCSIVLPAGTPERSFIEWGGRTPRDSTNGTVRVCAADVNNDGNLDIFFANYGKNGLFLGRGGTKYEDVSEAWGIAIDSHYDTCAFDDFDNDGLIDLYVNGTVANGINYGDLLFHNTGGAFEDVTPPSIGSLKADHGAQWMDFDRDGAVDLALTGSGADGMHYVMRNLLGAGLAAHSLSVRVVDAEGRDIRAGTEVRIYHPGTQTILGTRIVDSGSGYNSQNVAAVHFGLGTATVVDVEARYPAGDRRLIAKVSAVEAAKYRGRDLIVRVYPAPR